MSEPLLHCSKLSVSFRTDNGSLRAVDGIDLSIAPGEALGLVGESGCGKSTAAMAILGLLPRSAQCQADAIRLGDTDLAQASNRVLRSVRGRRVGVVFQDPMTSLNPYLTVGKQIGEPLRIHLGLNASQAKERSLALMRDVGIPDAATRINRHPHEFSGGQRQRLLIAMALACDPELLIADEPTTALDVTVQAQILDLLRREQQRRNMALLLVSHDLGVIAHTCHRVAVMYAGRIVETANTKPLFANPQHPYTRGLLAAIPRLDGDRGTELTTIPGLPPRLSDGWQHCAFAPRCPHAEGRCRIDIPNMRQHSDEHHHRCILDLPAGDAP
ncbi:MAG: ABC transporter ATP-binding protein [Planctomycetota bacterium]|jgi:oligopeptide transport system ATP-binding protein|nr:ABC transporter ATP-binding protein [Planctomycetota bacterium]